MVEQIEEVDPELDIDSFSDFEVFVEREVSVDLSRARAISTRLEIGWNGSNLIADEGECRRVVDLVATAIGIARNTRDQRPQRFVVPSANE